MRAQFSVFCGAAGQGCAAFMHAPGSRLCSQPRTHGLGQGRLLLILPRVAVLLTHAAVWYVCDFLSAAGAHHGRTTAASATPAW